MAITKKVWILAIAMVVALFYSTFHFLSSETKKELDTKHVTCRHFVDDGKSTYVEFSQPVALFDGNQWYHIGEHFLSRSHILREIELKSHLNIVVPTPRCTEAMTKFSMFMMALSFNLTDPNLHIRFYEHNIHAQVEQGIPLLLRFTYAQEPDPIDRIHEFLPNSNNRDTSDPDHQQSCYHPHEADPNIPLLSPTNTSFWFRSKEQVDWVKKNMEVLCNAEGSRAEIDATVREPVRTVSKSNSTSGNIQIFRIAHKVKSHRDIFRRRALRSVLPPPVVPANTVPLPSYGRQLAAAKKQEKGAPAVSTAAASGTEATASTGKAVDPEVATVGTKATTAVVGAVDMKKNQPITGTIGDGGAASGFAPAGNGSMAVAPAVDTRKKKFEMLVYQRDANRIFMNLYDKLAELANIKGLGSWDINVYHHSEEQSACTLRSYLRTADVMLTTHGFQSTAVMFMKPGAVLVEVFPYKYYKESYFAVAYQFAVHHRWMRNLQPTAAASQVLRLTSQQQCMASIKCRSFARGMNVELPDSHMQNIIKIMKQVQTGVLGAHNAPQYKFCDDQGTCPKIYL